MLDAGRAATNFTQNLFRGANDASQLAAERDRLQEENAALAAQLRAAQAQALSAQHSGNVGEPSDPLLRAQLVEARVLGKLARQHLAGRELLDVGANQQLEADALVVDAPVTAQIDIGSDRSIEQGNLVLLGRRVLGRIEQVGHWTSTVRRITSPGYRDLVRLAHVDGNHVHFAAQGVLEGTGEPLCRIRLVAVTEPVSVGDLVYTIDSDGLTPAPLLYGRIVRTERISGDAHWQLWLEPATGDQQPGHVAVLRAATNPQRTAAIDHALTKER